MFLKTRTITTFIALGFVWMACVVQAHEFKAGSLVIGHPWVQVVPGLSGGAGYLKITNTGGDPDRLLGATINGGEQAEVHSTSAVDGMMRAVPGGLEIKPGQTVTLAPGAYHFMLTNLKGPFSAGGVLKGVIEFQKAGTVPVEFTVEPISTRRPAHHAH
jgi:copper(I)-binding protein